MISNSLLEVNISPEELIASLAVQIHIETVLNFNRDIHNQYQDKSGNTIGCGCIYCLTLHRYANLKKLIHKINNRIISDNYIYPTDKLEVEDIKYLKALKSICNNVKKEKNLLKNQLKL